MKSRGFPMQHIVLPLIIVTCLQVCGGQNSITSDLWHQERPANLPQIQNLEVMCAKDHMEVQLSFDRPFDGLVFSKGQFGHDNCVYVQPNTGSVNFRFSIIYNGCGTKPDAKGKFYENTVVVQYDEELIEVWDEAKRLRCEWYNDYEKTATKPPMVISDLEVIELNFRGDNVDCWMEIQNGKGPWASPITGIVPLGSTLTMVVAINDLAGEFDMRVKSCEASDGVNRPILLSDEHGCVLRPKMVSKFLKLRSNDGRSTVISYAFFHAFKFPDSLQVYVRCKVEICRFGCPDHCDKTTGAADQSSYTSEIKASFAAPAGGRAVPVVQPLPPQPPQLLPPQFTPQKYPERRTRPDPEAPQEVTRRPFFNLGNKPAFANFFQRKKDSILALPVLAPPPAGQRMDAEAQVFAVPIPIPGSQTQADQVMVAAPVALVQPKEEVIQDQKPKARQAGDSSAATSGASGASGGPEEGKPISEDKYSERSSRFPHGPRSLNLDDLKNMIHISDAEEYAEAEASPASPAAKSRKRRYAFHERHVRSADVGVVTGYEVISAVDLAFTPNASSNGAESVTIFQGKMHRSADDVVYGVCLPAPGFSALFVLLAMCVVISVLVASFLCYHRQLQKDDREGVPTPVVPPHWNSVHFIQKSLESQS